MTLTRAMTATITSTKLKPGALSSNCSRPPCTGAAGAFPTKPADHPSPAVHDQAAAARLRAVSEELTGVTFEGLNPR